MNHGVSGETMNMVYDQLGNMTVEEIERFKSLATIGWGRGEVRESAYFLMMHQASYALERGWHK